jgi:hypothetical protein
MSMTRCRGCCKEVEFSEELIVHCEEDGKNYFNCPECKKDFMVRKMGSQTILTDIEREQEQTD